MSAALSVQAACKTYANGFTALHDVSFDVAQGEFFALLGPNGAGKTTLISAIAGLNRLSSGTVEVLGRNVVADTYQTRCLVGVVPQELVFDPFFSVREVLRIQSGYFGIRRNDDWIDELLHHLGLSAKADTNMRNLSGGMKRRVLVAQALVHRPPVIILDEPTAGVDVELRHSLWTFMRLLNREGHTVMLTTHYLEEAQQHCKRIAVLKQGRLVALDETERLLDSGQGVCIELLLSGALPAALQPLCMSQQERTSVLQLDSFEQIADVLACLKSAGTAVERLRVLETDLEQVFIGLTATEPTP